MTRTTSIHPTSATSTFSTRRSYVEILRIIAAWKLRFRPMRVSCQPHAHEADLPPGEAGHWKSRRMRPPAGVTARYRGPRTPMTTSGQSTALRTRSRRFLVAWRPHFHWGGRPEPATTRRTRRTSHQLLVALRPHFHWGGRLRVASHWFSVALRPHFHWGGRPIMAVQIPRLRRSATDIRSISHHWRRRYPQRRE